MTIVDIAKGEIGYQETGNNDTKYGKWFGLNNQPWCAIFVSWVYHQAKLGSKVKTEPRWTRGFASCAAGLAGFAKDNKLVPVGQAQEGDIVFFQFDTDAQPDHVGIVLKNQKLSKTLLCIEGNTSPSNKGSQSNGGGVYQKKRSYAMVMAVVRP